MGDGVQQSIEKVDRLGGTVAAGNLQGFVEDDGEGGSLEADHLGHGHAHQVAVNGGHAFQTPVF